MNDQMARAGGATTSQTGPAGDAQRDDDENYGYGPRSFQRLVAWLLATPILAFWPFVSALPAFAFLNSEATVVGTFIEACFLATGFFGVAGGYVFARITARDFAVPMVRAAAKNIAAYLGAYALVWMTLYFLYRTFVA